MADARHSVFALARCGVLEVWQTRVPLGHSGQMRRENHATGMPRPVLHIERRVAELQQMGRALERVARRCRGRGPTSECPILEVLDDEEAVDAEG